MKIVNNMGLLYMCKFSNPLLFRGEDSLPVLCTPTCMCCEVQCISPLLRIYSYMIPVLGMYLHVCAN